MEVFWSILLLFVVTLLTLGHVRWGKSKGNRGNTYPPGPGFSLPLLGNLLQLGLKPHKAFAKWRKIYGPIFGFQMGSQYAVVVSEAKLVKELFSRASTTGRPHSPVIDSLIKENIGIIGSVGKRWEEQRRFAIRSLKDLGITKGGVIEDIMLCEAKNLITFLKERVDLPLQGKRLFNGVVFNSLWTVVSGERIVLESSKIVSEEGLYVKLAGDLIGAFNYVVSTGLFMAPWLRYIFPCWSGWTRLLDSRNALDKAAYEAVNRSRQLDNPQIASNFIQKYLYQIQSTEQKSSCFYQDTGRENLLATIAELFIAGSETTATSLEYILLYLTQFPHVQKEVQMEVDRAFGSFRFPCLNDKPKLPYTEALIMESMRRSPLLPLGAPHKTLEDIEFHGLFIPKNTILFADLYNIHRDPALWHPDPDEFRPERHLNEDKTKVVRNVALMPFSSGKRQCIGDTYAKDSLFLNIACLMQTFTVNSYDGKVDVDDGNSGLVLSPKPFKVVFSLRNK